MASGEEDKQPKDESDTERMFSQFPAVVGRKSSRGQEEEKGGGMFSLLLVFFSPKSPANWFSQRISAAFNFARLLLSLLIVII